MGAITHNGEVLQRLPANASQINFDKTGTDLNSTQTENAIKEVNTKVNTNTEDITQLKSGLTSVTITMPNQIPPNDTPNDFNDMCDRAITMYRIGDTTSMTNAPATGLYGVVISYRFGAYILQAFHHSNGMYQRFSFDSGATWGTWLQIK